MPRMTPIFSERPVDRDQGVGVPQPAIPYKISRVLKETLSSQDSRKLFNGAEGIRWSLRRSNVTRMSAQDMCRIVPGAVLV